jgi:hypothetical protein
MRWVVIQETAAVFTVLALAFAAALGHPVVLLGLGILLLAGGSLGYWRSASLGWLLTPVIGGLVALVTALVGFVE